MEAGIEALARLLNLRDGYTGLHAERASTLAGAVGERLGNEFSRQFERSR